jgi:hypothetical protein
MTTITVKIIRKVSGNSTLVIEDGRIVTRTTPPTRFQRVIKRGPRAGCNRDHKMKALSIRQPYASLIIAGIKNVENRSWGTKYTGQLVICATKSPDAKKWWEPMRDKCAVLGVKFPEALCCINGAALGVVDLNHMVWTAEDGATETDHPTIPQADLMTWWNPDMIGFILEHPLQLLTPVPVIGRLGLYNLPEDVAAQIKKQLQ